MARGKSRVIGEWVYMQLCQTIDTEAVLGLHAQLQRSVDVALQGHLDEEERQQYARRLLRQAWLRIGEIVFDRPRCDVEEALPP